MRSDEKNTSADGLKSRSCGHVESHIILDHTRLTVYISTLMCQSSDLLNWPMAVV